MFEQHNKQHDNAMLCHAVSTHFNFYHSHTINSFTMTRCVFVSAYQHVCACVCWLLLLFLSFKPPAELSMC